MKNLTHVFSGSAMLCASLLLFSCKKQFVDTTELQATASIHNVSECRPAAFGVYYDNQWLTLAQKWYSNQKVKYLKAKSTRYAPTFTDLFLELMYDLDWGEVLYQGNQVYLRDVLNDRVLMRITLDEQGRPAASYYYNQRPGSYPFYPPGTAIYWYDTTYYYYNGDRLDDMISLFESNAYGTASPIHSWRKYKFSYDSWGNVIEAALDWATFKIEYDYTKPVQGVVLNYQLTSSLSLLEHLELIKLPMHHVVKRMWYGDTSNSTEYKDYQITDGFVRSYVCVAPSPLSIKSIFYNGWDCGMNNSSSSGNAIANLQQFQYMFPER